MSEQQATSACPHPEAVGQRWGDPISEERQAELQGYLDRWDAETDPRDSRGPFDGVSINGADAYWLARRSMSKRGADTVVTDLHLEGANLSGAHMEGAAVVGVHLEGAWLNEVHLEGADLTAAHLEGTLLSFTYLERAYLNRAHLEEANLTLAHLEGANLFKAFLDECEFQGTHLEGAILSEVHLEGRNLHDAHLEGANLARTDLNRANLTGAHLEGADLTAAHLEGANLIRASLDTKTDLSAVFLDGNTRLGDVHWGGVGSVDLTQIDWRKVSRLGDEQSVGLRAKADVHEAVVRAYRQLAAQLRAQGMTEVADRFAYRANVRQRRVYLRRFRLPQFLGSLFLDLISGYGYRPARSLFAYVLVILGFAATYFALGGANGQTLSWNEAIVISMTAFHGRGFFSAVFQPGDLQAAVAAVEAFIGLLIEIVLIATFTQRFFAR
jgi:uncharacterized protein YjbI with pentapeptide repeats